MARIPLTQGRHTLVDDSDVGRIQNAFRSLCAVNQHGYWYASGRLRDGQNIALHHFLLQAPAGTMVDHKNGDGLDNRRSNIRLCTPAENARNRRYRKEAAGRSRFRGVTWRADVRLWEARVGCDGKRYSAGLYETEGEAAKAYDWLAVRLHGRFAAKNHQGESPRAPFTFCSNCEQAPRSVDTVDRIDT